MAENKEQIAFREFINGDLGLAKTYWIFLVLAYIIFNTLLFFVTQSGERFSIFLLLICWYIYEPIALIALARAIKKYQGKNIWKNLAIIALVLAWAGYVIGILNFLSVV